MIGGVEGWKDEGFDLTKEEASERNRDKTAKFANYRSCRGSSTASTQTQFLVGTAADPPSRRRQAHPAQHPAFRTKRLSFTILAFQ
jgi:hypothetical protein